MSRANGDARWSGRARREPERSAAAPLRILVAEDNEFNAQLLEQLLVRRGHRVRVANNGRERWPWRKREASTCCSWTSTCRSWTASR